MGRFAFNLDDLLAWFDDSVAAENQLSPKPFLK
jgi:hypothetical protein